MYYYDQQIKDDETSRACSMYDRDQNYIISARKENNGENHLGRNLRHHSFGGMVLNLRAVFRVPPGYMAGQISMQLI
jgi:hypothetical protein